MDARQDTPIDTSSPVGVVNPLWHARQSCDVRNNASAWPAGTGVGGAETCWAAVRGCCALNTATSQAAAAMGSSGDDRMTRTAGLITSRPAGHHRTSPTGST